MKKIVLSIFCSLIIAMGGFYVTVLRPALAGVTCSLPFTLTNGTIADATQVMANYNALVTCLSNAAAAGANNDITSLSGLTTPITPGEGGSNVYIASNPVDSVIATANTLVIAVTSPTGWANATGQSVVFVSPFTNISTVQAVVNNQATVNVFKLTSSGPIALAGGEIVTNQAYQMIFDGTRFEINPFPNVTAGWGIAVAPTAVSINTKNPPYGFGPCVNMTISATVGSNLLGLQLFAADTGVAPTSTHPILCSFRDATIANGDPVWVSLESAQYMDTNAAGASLGTVAGVPFRIWVVLYYNGGTPKLGLWQSTTFTVAAQAPQGNNFTVSTLDEAALLSPTAISGGATSAGTFYTSNGLTISNSPFRILGYFDFNSGLTTPGNYASGPTKIQLFGPGIKKPGDRINFVKSTLATGQFNGSTYTISATKPTAAAGATVVSVSFTPTASMDVLDLKGSVSSGVNGGGSFTPFIYDGTSVVAVAAGTSVSSNPASVPVGYSTIVTSGSKTFTLLNVGAANTCINGIAGSGCQTSGGLVSWLSIEEIQP